MTVSTAELLTNIAYAGVYLGELCAGRREAHGEPPVILAWHDVQPSEASAFRRQVTWLAKHRRVVAVQDIDAQSNGCISLTFDDGLESVIRTVAPILDDLGVVGTAFVPTRLLGSAGYLDRADVSELGEGLVVSFGAHSRTHRRLSALSQSELDAEIRGSKDDLEAILGRPVEGFCYPFGKMLDVEAAAVQTCSAAGFRFGYSTVRKAVDCADSAYWIPRICVSPRMPPTVLAGLLDGVFWPEVMITSLAKAIGKR